MLRRIGELYVIEAEVRGKPPIVRQRVRQERARPLLDSLERWLRERLLTLSPQSDTAKAINYMLNQWQALNYYCENGIAEIDNNIVENALRVVSLGRKNFLFMGADSGGDRAAAMYSLTGQARGCRARGLPTPRAHPPLQTTQSIVSTNCCPGTWRRSFRQTAASNSTPFVGRRQRRCWHNAYNSS